MNEQKLISKIQTAYDEVLEEIPVIIKLPGFQTISSFTDEQKQYLSDLVQNQVNLLIKITLIDQYDQEIEISDPEPENSPFNVEQLSSYKIQRLTFNFNEASVWILLYFQDEIKLIAETETVKTPSNKINIILLLIASLLCFAFTIFMVNAVWIFFLRFVAACILFKVVTDLVSAIFTNKRKEKQENTIANDMIICQYFAYHLQDYATKKLLLDDPDYEA
nr:hypothetical protein [Acinetobacter sp. Marseille-Q1620]